MGSRTDIVHAEQQILLRLPEKMAEQVREAMRKGGGLEDRLTVEFLGKSHSHSGPLRYAKVVFDGTPMQGKIVDLPCIVESHKTFDNKTLYKTADISQMILCTEVGEEELQTLEAEIDASSRPQESRKQFLWNKGITPPLKNVRKRRFRKTAPRKFPEMESPEVENEVRRLLREDYQAVNVRYEVHTDDSKPEAGQSGSAGGSSQATERDGEDDEDYRVLYDELELSSESSSADSEIDIFGGIDYGENGSDGEDGADALSPDEMDQSGTFSAQPG